MILIKGKEFSGEIFCIVFRKNFCIVYNRISTNHILLKLLLVHILTNLDVP